MTRAREQLILPWLETDKPNTMQNYVSRININKYPHKTAIYSDGMSNKDTDGESIIKIGSVKLNPQKTPESIKSNISPTALADNLSKHGLVDNLGEIISIEYGSPVDLTCLDKYQADEVGTWVHQCYQVLITKPEIRERLFSKLSAINAHSELKEQLIVQVENLKSCLDESWGASSYKTELPMLSIVESGATLSGILDLLVETSEGYWIVDHKTDRKTDEKKFKHHLPQLLAYAKHITLNKPILGVAINWVREGRLAFVGLEGNY
jgi:ATP-dependent exoDNAse (exonuclease V) beta subunit